MFLFVTYKSNSLDEAWQVARNEKIKFLKMLFLVGLQERGARLM